MSLNVPDQPIIPFIEGRWRRPRHHARDDQGGGCCRGQGLRRQAQIQWMEVFAGEKYQSTAPMCGCPTETLRAVRDYVVSIKGPLTTPVGGGIRSLNVALRRSWICTCACAPCSTSGRAFAAERA